MKCLHRLDRRRRTPGSLNTQPVCQPSQKIVVGVDVGGSRKGFHAVALRGSQYAGKLATCDAAEVVTWCRERNAGVVAVDAPCRWSLTGRRRACEGELALLGISAFPTPSRAIGEVHPFYGWMLNGSGLFRRLSPYYGLYDGGGTVPDRLCFETFPQAIACALAGRTLSARHKRADRRSLLRQAGIVTEALTNVDELDAALCALAACLFVAGAFNAYGDKAEGFIVVPAFR